MVLGCGCFFHFVENNSVPFGAAGGGGDALDQGNKRGDADEEADDDASGAEVGVEGFVIGGEDGHGGSEEAGAGAPEISDDLRAENVGGHLGGVENGEEFVACGADVFLGDGQGDGEVGDGCASADRVELREEVVGPSGGGGPLASSAFGQGGEFGVKIDAEFGDLGGCHGQNFRTSTQEFWDMVEAVALDVD